MFQTKKAIASQLANIKMKREVTGPIISELPETVLKDTEDARRMMNEMKSRHTSGVMKEQNKLRHAVLQSLLHINTDEWKNIPIPVKDTITEIITFANAINKINVHHEHYLSDLTTVL
jgi:hypothetical protein